MIALLIAYEAITRIFAPVRIHFAETGDPDRLSRLGRKHRERFASERRRPSSMGMDTGTRTARTTLTSSAASAPMAASSPSKCSRQLAAAFRLRAETGPALTAQAASIETVRADGARQLFAMKDEGGYLEFDRRNTRAARIHRASADRRADLFRRIRRACSTRKGRRRATTICARP